MIYEVKITYDNKEIVFKAPKKYFAGHFTLQEFLKHTREYNEAYNNKHPLTPEEIDEFKKLENSEEPITQDYLKKFAKKYNMPQKIVRIGKLNEENPKAEFANRLYQLRIKKGYKQSEIAEKIGVSTNTYTGYESGRNEPDLQTIVKIAKEYGVTLEYLAGMYKD